MPQRFRPLGLTLAILAAFLVYGFLPVLPALFVLLPRLQGHMLMPADSSFWLSALAGLLVMVLCVFAWIGRPSRVRLLLMGVLLAAAAINLYTTLRPSSLQFEIGIGGGSLDSLFHGALLCLLPLQFLVLVYTLWYCSRAPARAFYES